MRKQFFFVDLCFLRYNVNNVTAIPAVKNESRMTKKKKTIAFALVLTALLAMGSCGDKTGKDVDATVAVTT